MALVEPPAFAILFQSIVRSIFKNPSPEALRIFFEDKSRAAFFLEQADKQDLKPLLFDRLSDCEMLSVCPGKIQRELRREAERQLLIEEARRSDYERLLGVLGTKVRFLILKGTALAYSLYPKPFLRLRCDTDLLIEEKDRDRVDRLMKDLGYHQEPQIHGQYVMPQAIYSKEDSFGVEHVYDIHWKPFNPHEFSEEFSFEELTLNSMLIPALGPDVRALSYPYALLVAAIHRMAHHYDDPRLLWLYDLHLLIENLSDREREMFFALSKEKHAGPLCARGLQLARDWFGTNISDVVLDNLQQGDEQALARVSNFSKKPSLGKMICLDLKALKGIRKKTAYLYEHLFPAPEYIRAKYELSFIWQVPFFYGIRWIGGLMKVLRAGFISCHKFRSDRHYEEAQRADEVISERKTGIASPSARNDETATKVTTTYETASNSLEAVS